MAYFGAEMMLKKTAKVFTKPWIGYVSFLLVFAIVISGFAFTDFFGFEKRIPDSEDIESAGIHLSYDFGYYEEYYKLPYYTDEGVIESIRYVHKYFIEKDQKVKDNDYYSWVVIRYTLKDGSIIERKYYVYSQWELDMIYNKLAENPVMRSYINEIR